MRKYLLIAAALIGLHSQALAADSSVPAMTAGGAVADTDLLYCAQSAGTLDRKCTPLQMAAYIFGKMSVDATANGTGAITLATVNANVGTFGSATACITTTQNAKGLTTAISAATCTPAIGSITGLGTGVATAVAVNVGTAGSVVVNGGALGTPSSGVGTNLTGTAAGFTAGTVTTNANLTGAITSVGNAASLGSFTSASLLAALTTKTGTGNNVFGTAPTIDSLNATTAVTLAFITGLTQCLQVNTSGVVSGTGAVCGGSGSSGANPTATAGDVAVNGVATTFTRSDAAPAIQKASSSLFGIAKVDNTTITAAAGVLSAVNTGTVTSVATGCGVSGGPITGTGTIIAQALVNLQSGTNYAILGTDCGKLLNLSNASPQVPTIAQAGTAGFLAGYFVQVCNQGAGTQTITPTTSTIGGAATFVLPAGSAAAPQCATVISDGTNYQVAPDFTRNAAITIASGTAALGTSAIASGACATVVTVTATNTATTDRVKFSYNSDPTAVTGYGASATGAVLTIYPYPTANNVNVKVCNSSSGSITPAAMTLNWDVQR